VNASTQTGNSVWNIHSIDFFGPALEYYEFDSSTNTLLQEGIFFTSFTSSDFNASITANAARDAFVTWSSVDFPTLTQVRFSGRCHGDPLGVISGGTAVKTSSMVSAQFDPNANRYRWGDYSAASPVGAFGSSSTAWIVNEWTESPAIWGSHITQIGFSPTCP
jgi:hypothetical protein